ncbi:DUF4314 domain-containing protein [Dactylosporangium sp. NPDC051485]|uniref:DUF4314 domain-containing protein n=1 Tax=Dactylosporangium sp. NPDC051485 TaxID=3154846 RepID=UPI0034491895
MPDPRPEHRTSDDPTTPAVPPAKIGDRVQVLHCSDPYTTLLPGTLGTVTRVDSRNTTHVRWDDGRQLGLIDGEDTFTIIETTQPGEPS